MRRLLVAALMWSALGLHSALADEPQTATWATEQQAQGEALFRAQDLVGAEAAHRAALEVRTRQAHPMGWAESTASAGAAQSFRGIRTRDAVALQGAITDYQSALEVYSRNETPAEWSRTQNNLATAYVWLAQVRGDGSVEQLEAAEAAFRNVLLRRGGSFDYASNVERRVSPFMNRVAAMD
jgi:tetratricopeptide (TPR) repeat protein